MKEHLPRKAKPAAEKAASGPQPRKGILILISGPSGTGKGTLCERLVAGDDLIRFSVSATTRTRREYEAEGVHYNFISEAQFDDLLAQDLLLEHATVHEHRYGTPRYAVEEGLRQGYDMLLDVDSQGALSVMKKMKDCVSVFILPPSFSTLQLRLRTRNTDDDVEIARRLRNARDEIKRYVHYDYALINDDLNSALARLRAIVTAERMRTSRFHPFIPEN
ncbi:MAG TPA: guanylate kinase [Candidatus Limnocylindria bacterium]|nr:guanylate kinase [Candidatus Limnocylindria bacterium]